MQIQRIVGDLALGPVSVYAFRLPRLLGPLADERSVNQEQSIGCAVIALFISFAPKALPVLGQSANLNANLRVGLTFLESGCLIYCISLQSDYRVFARNMDSDQGGSSAANLG